MKRPALILILAAAMTAFLAFMVISHEHARNSGTEVILNMEPVDPRSLFRGHYVRIRTDLQTIDFADVKGETGFEKGDRIFVIITGNDENGWEASSLSTSRPNTGTFLQGRVQRIRYKYEKVKSENGTTQREKLPKGVTVRYAVESYFASQAEAKALENKMRDRDHKMRLILAVDKHGKAVIRGLEIDDKRYIDKL